MLLQAVDYLTVPWSVSFAIFVLVSPFVHESLIIFFKSFRLGNRGVTSTEVGALGMVPFCHIFLGLGEGAKQGRDGIESGEICFTSTSTCPDQIIRVNVR